MTVVTRFAPSPTGFLHIGSARTALFNWLYAKHHGGKFLLRIEDTDRARSTEEAIQAIINSMKWLQLDWDGEIVYQFSRAARHAEVAHQLLAEGKAYYCYCTPEELEQMREKARAEGRSPRYDGRWRERDASEAPAGVKPVIRLKAPLEGESVVHDLVQGEVRVAHDQLDDMVLLRGDGTPTYMLAVVVDDHDMGITHVIRGDDHLTNTFRQKQIYEAMGWDVPSFSHIPLIHGQDGAKLSKRHGALGVEAYKEMGFLPEALLNYLLRLGWGHGDDEIISREQSIEWFDIADVGRSASRFDMAKLTNLNAHYLREADNQRLLDLLHPFIGRHGLQVNAASAPRLIAGMPGLKQRARTLEDLADSALIYLTHLSPDDKAGALLNVETIAWLAEFVPSLQQVDIWSHQSLEQAARSYAEAKNIGLGKLAQPLRVALTGRTVSPGIFEVMEILGKDESLARLKSVLQR